MKNFVFRQLKRKIGWLLKTTPLTKRLFSNWILKKDTVNLESILAKLETVDRVIVNNPKVRLGIVKDKDSLSISYRPYWPHIERFARSNIIPFSFMDMHGSDWINECKNLDLIVWRQRMTTGLQELD